jgi:hypothetical protein
MLSPQVFNITSGSSEASSSGWLIAIVTATLTAFGTFWVQYLLEVYKRYRDARALAETFIAEISAVLRLFDDLRTEETYSNVRSNMQQRDTSSIWEGAAPDTFTFPVTVYEKCADRVGTLGKEVAADVVRFYNFLNGFRMAARSSTSAGPLSIPSRIKMIDFMLYTVKNERVSAENLIKRLRVIADRRFLP